MDYLENIGEKLGLGNVDLDNIKKQSAFFLKDKYKAARIWLTDVPASQLLTEDATNDEEWGPTTKTMAAIADACHRPNEYRCIKLVLQGRLELIGKKYWRQFLKTLTVIEYLLLHGPSYVRLDVGRDLIDELTHFKYVDERSVDRGIVVRNKAKRVLQLVMEDDFLEEERRRAIKLSEVILGQGSFQSSNSGTSTSRYGGFGSNPLSSQASNGLMSDMDADDMYVDKKFTAFEERILSEKRGQRQEKAGKASGGSTKSDWRAFEDEAASPASTQNAAGADWADFDKNLSPSRSPRVNGMSPVAGKRGIPEGEVSIPCSPGGSTLTSATQTRVLSPLSTSSSSTDNAKAVRPEVSTVTRSISKKKAYVPVSSSSDFKLPPPPPPPGGSKVTIKPSRFSQPAQSLPDLLDMGFDAPSTSADPASFSEVLAGDETHLKGPNPDEAAMDLLGLNSNIMDLTSGLSSLDNHTSGKVPDSRSPGLVQVVPDLFDISTEAVASVSADSSSLPGTNAAVVKDAGSTISFPDLFPLGRETSNPSLLDFFDTSAEASYSPLSGQQADVGPVSDGVPDFLTMNSGGPSRSNDIFSFEDKVSLPKKTGAGATGLPEAAPDAFDSIAPNFASFGIHESHSKPVAKPADDFFNLLV